MSVEIEVIRKIHDNEDGSSITVGPDVDGLGLIEISMADTGRLVLKREMASAVALALLATCNDMNPQGNNTAIGGTTLLPLKGATS